MLPEQYELISYKIQLCHTLDKIVNTVQEELSDLGFEGVGITSTTKLYGKNFYVKNYPIDWQDIYKIMALHEIDPVHCFNIKNFSLTSWELFNQKVFKQYNGIQSECGVKNGFSMKLLSTGAVPLYFSTYRSKKYKASPHEINFLDHIAKISLLKSHDIICKEFS